MSASVQDLSKDKKTAFNHEFIALDSEMLMHIFGETLVSSESSPVWLILRYIQREF